MPAMEVTKSGLASDGDATGAEAFGTVKRATTMKVTLCWILRLEGDMGDAKALSKQVSTFDQNVVPWALGRDFDIGAHGDQSRGDGPHVKVVNPLDTLDSRHISSYLTGIHALGVDSRRTSTDSRKRRQELHSTSKPMAPERMGSARYHPVASMISAAAIAPTRQACRR